MMISTAASPSTANDFHNSSGSDQLVVGYFKGNGTTGLCVSVKPTAAGVPGIQNGTNVTLQMVYDGGDGTLYQVMPPPHTCNRFVVVEEKRGTYGC